ncbi:MAG: hypothetical protein M4D80_41270 [Myxococcota bacterium]|nr:hypothetical protein [Myxococcota bacterium]
MRISIHIAQFSKDRTIERGASTARAADDAQYICTQLLIAGVDAEVVDGPVSDAPESAYWIVFENELPWHVTSLGAARRDRIVVLRPSGRIPFVVGDEFATVTYASASEWSEGARTGAIQARGAQPSGAPTLAVQLVTLLRAEKTALPAAATRGPFPIGETVGGRDDPNRRAPSGRRLPEALSRARRSQAQLIVAFDVRLSRVDIRAFQHAVAYESPGVLPFAFVGKLDFREGIDISEASETWVLAERATEGAWLPSLLGRFGTDALADPESRRLPSYDPKTAVPNALALGRSAGRILVTAAERGRRLTRVRPEYMWARDLDGCLEVTGLSARADRILRDDTRRCGP